MNEEKKISVIIPAYNEEDAIGKVLGPLLPMADANGWQVIVVDDGSTDATAKVADQNGVKVTTHPYNRGYGSSLKTGIGAATAEIVVFMDSGGQRPGVRRICGWLRRFWSFAIGKLRLRLNI